MEKPQIRISVRNLVEFIFRHGDIDNRQGTMMNSDAMMEGTRIHRKIQRSKGKNYLAEVPLKIALEKEKYTLVIEGRADGIFTGKDGTVTVDEIKGSYRKLELMEEPVYVHKAQAMCYAYIFSYQNKLDDISVQMTYCNLDTEELRYFTEQFCFEDLKIWFYALIEEYRKWADFQFESKKIRQDSIKTLEFPFLYRNGQYKLAGDVYRTIKREKTLFIQAPTGVGKTISTIFPAIKAVGENLSDRIFYLTAKTITASVARETFGILQKNGYRAKTIQITAKEKLCMCEEMECNPVNCPNAKGHYDRVNDAVFDLLHKKDVITREEILLQAEKYQVCPFEMCLDTSSWSDNIICDYNYLFDPNVYLKRFFQEGVKGDYIFLIDEAHNLVDRGRRMYSAAICKEDFLAVKKILKPKSRRLEKLLEKCNRILLEYKRECDGYEVYDNIANLLFALMQLASALDEFLQKNTEFPERSRVMDFYFGLRNFLNIYELVDERYVIYTEFLQDGRFCMNLFCVDPSQNLQKCLDRGNAAIFFSATFLPIHYYKQLLSTREDNYAVYAQTSFRKEQSLVLIGRDVSTKYTRRTESEFQKISSYIHKVVTVKKGNYMIFFPSYKMMQQVYEVFLERYGDVCDILLQEPAMTEQKREEFLAEFDEKRDRAFAAFCVMGGIFGEGIDLKNDRLIGTVIVGTGLPQIGNEQEILKKYYDSHSGSGFDYAFRYPGMNKVLQAAGRVIRTEKDKGIILLLDERFLSPEYDALYPREWKKRTICTLADVKERMEEFWDCQDV